MYAHTLKTSGQKAYRAMWYPTSCDKAMKKEQDYPLMVLESGQITRVNYSNLKKND